MEGFGPRRLILLVLMVAITTATSAGAESRQPSPDDHRPYSREIAEASARYAVPEGLIRAVIRVESGFDRRAVSPKGARGLMQLMPQTAAVLGVRDSFDPRENIHGGTRHLRAMMERFRYNPRLAVAAYNAGEKAVAEFGGVPPYPETQDYVIRVLRLYNAQGQWDDWQPSGAQPIAGGRVHRLVQSDGAILYTNIPFGGSVAASRGR